MSTAMTERNLPYRGDVSTAPVKIEYVAPVPGETSY